MAHKQRALRVHAVALFVAAFASTAAPLLTVGTAHASHLKHEVSAAVAGGVGRQATFATSSSPNWSGYALSGGHYTSVTGNWNVPAVSAPPVSAVASGPAAAVDSTGTQVVFFRGSNGNIHESWFSGAWNGPVDEGSAWAAAAGTAPAVTATSGQQIVFFQGTNGTIHEAWYANGQWNGPVDMGWAATSGPGVTVDSSGTQLVFFRGTNGTIHEAWYTGRWNGPIDLGSAWASAAGSSPGVTTTTGQQIVFFQGTNGTIHEAWYVNGWNGPVDQGWAATSGPGVAVDSSGTQLVFFRGTNGTIHEAWFTGTWNGPADLGSGWAATPGTGPGVTTTTGQQLVFWERPDATLSQAWFTGTWHGPQSVPDQSTTRYSSAWVGIDGYGNSNLIQAGTEQDVTPTGTRYYVWWEILPAYQTVIQSVTVNPGDRMTASIALSSGSTWRITITNTTNGQTFSTLQTYTGAASTAEWVMERPYVSGAYATLAPYSTFAFDAGTVNGGSPGLTTSNELVMTQNGSQVSTPSSPDSERDGFNVAYGPSAPAPPPS
jgi:hypothetical protein